MSTMLRREWRSVFHSLWGYGFLALFAFVFGLMATVFHSTYGYTNFEFGLPYYGVAAALSFPLLTVPFFRREHRGEEDQLLGMLPISAKDWILGKLLCLVCVWSAACAVSALYPLVLHWMVGVALPSAYLSLLVLYLFGLALLLVEAFASLAIKRTPIAWIVSYGIPVALILVNNLADLIPWMGVKSAVEYLSLFGAVTPFVFSLFDARVWLLYGSVIALFFLLAYLVGKRRMEGKLSGRKKKVGVLLVSGLVAVALLFNVAVTLVPARYRTADVSSAKLYSMADSTKDFLATVDEDVTLYLIKEDSVKADMRLEYFLNRFVQYSKHLTLKTLKPEDSTEILEKVGVSADQLTSVGYCLVAETEKRSEIIDYNSLFYYETSNSALNQLGLSRFSVSDYYEWVNTFYSYANQNETYLTYLDAILNETYMYFQGQSILCAMLEYVLADVIPTHYALTGHGELEFGSSMMAGMLMTFGKVNGILDLTTVSEIPEDVASILIMDPAEDYSAQEIEILKRYLSRGGQVTVVTGEKHLSMPNLMSLMASYGMSASAGAVGIDETVTVEGEEGQEPTTETQRTSSVKVTPNLSHAALAAGISEPSLAPVVTNGNAISFSQTGDASLTVTELLTTSDKAFVGEDRTTQGRKILAAAAETADGAHLLWFTGAESYAVKISEQSKYADAVSNVYCLYMAESWATLNYRSEVKKPAATLYQVEYAAPTSSQATLFGIVTIGALPLTLLCCGLVLWYKRKKA